MEALEQLGEEDYSSLHLAAASEAPGKRKKEKRKERGGEERGGKRSKHSHREETQGDIPIATLAEAIRNTNENGFGDADRLGDSAEKDVREQVSGKGKKRALDPVEPSPPNPFQRSSTSTSTKQRRKKTESDSHETDAYLRALFRDPQAMNDWLAGASLGKSELSRLEKEGIVSYKKGKFTEDERASIKLALETYQAANRMDSTELTLLAMTKTNRASDRETLKDFWHTIASSVPGRPILNVQPFVRRMLDPKAHKGKWTVEEDALLLRAYGMHPRLWCKISTIVDRTEVDCRDRYLKELVNRETRTTGRWTSEEEEKLARIVKDVMGAGVGVGDRGEDVPWDTVAARMGTRSITQCRIKWRDGIASIAEGKSRDKDKTAKVIARLRSMGYKNERHIIWADVQDDSLKEFKLKEIRNSYSNMKKTLLRDPLYVSLGFSELMDVMYHKATGPRKRLTGGRGLTNASKETVDESGDEA